ncbi:MAG TPA: carboxylating nicotinate-nucleotide diphosphorylase [Acidimicrobiales bacterium]|nr:carboxylating nicotinate-nucleotide diphosphorylase [Acidimicrobiales bacterium]
MSPGAPPWEELREIVARAVAEDLPDGDPTGAAVGPRGASASIVARQSGIIAGLFAAQLVLDEVSNRLGTGRATAQLAVDDGERVGVGTALGELNGPARTLLAAERTVLNIVTHLSGIATMTAAFVEAVAGTAAVVRDTRKTLPGLRAAEKYAVRCGGGANHRMSLSDALLVKDNHIAALGGVKAAVEAARRQAQANADVRGRREPLPLEVEVDNLEELDEALAAGAGLVLVDNMSLADTAEAVRRANELGAEIEASGGLTLANIRAVAECGVHYLAVGALTHSAPALDVALDWRIDL